MGAPTRTSRAGFGPKYRNSKKVTIPESDIADVFFNLLFHQVAGMNLLSAAAYVNAHWSGSAMVTDAHAEWWNPDQKTVTPYDAPVVTRSGTGVYQVQYNAQYPNENDELVTIDVQNPRGWVTTFTGTNHIGNVKATRTDARTIALRVYEWNVGTSTDWALSDRPFLLFWGP